MPQVPCILLSDTTSIFRIPALQWEGNLTNTIIVINMLIPTRKSVVLNGGDFDRFSDEQKGDFIVLKVVRKERAKVEVCDYLAHNNTFFNDGLSSCICALLPNLARFASAAI